MKFAAFVFALVLSLITFAANASVQTPGTFAPTVCGSKMTKTAIYLIDIEKVCVGQAITYDRAKVEAVEFHMTTGQVELFVISEMQEAGTNEFVAKLQNEDGEELEVNMSRDSQGNLESMSGKLNVINFKVNAFDDMVNAQ